MDIEFLWDTLLQLLPGIPLTLQLSFYSVAIGFCFALLLAFARLSPYRWLSEPARIYVFCFRGTPLLVQLFLIYYGLGQFESVRHSFLWPMLREPYGCALLTLSLCTAAYGSEILRGGLLSVPHGALEAARACGMSRLLMVRRIILPIAIRQALPAYGNELISMVQSTSLCSIITLMDITGIAAQIISDTYRALEVFMVTGVIYLLINLVISRIVMLLEYRLTPHLRATMTLAVKKHNVIQ
ncbi:ABC transporter permease [Rouxiella silvae]|uniref:Arginine ABC transporter permease protein ArtM n=1 Tax=Rouxiella silvae TaxID=1646373 RepID=A0AA40X3W2_9GAMM|nr:ABC transporter permease [Rouxiella silvae]KQN46488.1 ABC transporter permease [Serratia sp. Leaf50]MBF6638093.1 ABC transporter permease [Rouxiella silvae]ORJ20402.1 ABC transporter permease [Rouxiella silvae]